MSTENRTRAEIGAEGESRVTEYLKGKGYIIIKRNWRDSRYGEIDIVAESKDEILFVEVRTRGIDALVSGAQSVDMNKLKRVKTAAQMFMSRFNSDLPYRIDVAEVSYGEKDGREIWKLNYIKNV